MFPVDPKIVLGIFVVASISGFIGTIIFNKETKDIELTET